MIKNYFVVALRNLFRNKMYSAINLFGLAVGITCVLFMLVYVEHELSYDRYHEKADRIYRLALSIRLGGNELERAIVGAPTAVALKNDFPEVEEVVRLKSAGSWYVRCGENLFKEPSIIFAESNIFNIFSIPLLRGDPETALVEPYTLIISETTSKKYFGNDNPLGKILTFDKTADYKITGVFKDIPANSHFHCGIIVSFVTINKDLVHEWTGLDVHTYLLLREGADPEELEAKFPQMVRKYCDREFRSFTGKDYKELKRTGNKWEYYLQPVASIHLHSNLGSELEPNNHIKYVYIFSTLAFFCLLIAGVNFINLTTARSARRAKEVGIRKVVGSGRSRLVAQFLTESVVMSMLALVIALCLINLLKPFFTKLIGRDIGINFLTEVTKLFFLVGIIIFVGIIAGSYPAFALSSFKPVLVLKQKFVEGFRTNWLRKSLVVFQFAISIILIIGTIIVFNQLEYIRDKDLGFQKDGVLLVHNAFFLDSKLEPFREKLLQNPGIAHATATSYLPVYSTRRERAVFPGGETNRKNVKTLQAWDVDYDFLKTFNMEIMAGRDFSREYSTDSSAVILNETAARMFGWNDPIGKRIGMDVSANPPRTDYFTVVGVVKNFHFDSLRNFIHPLALFLRPTKEYLAIRLHGQDMAGTLGFIKDTWKAFVPGYPFEYSFLDGRFNNMYSTELRTGRLLSIFLVLAVIINCLGLFGLAAYTTDLRTKEISVRKVLGATVSEILLLLFRQFSTLIFISFVMAAPVSYYIMSNWLQDFAYRVPVEIGPFLLSGVLMLLISMITVSYYTLKMAFLNPVKGLKYE